MGGFGIQGAIPSRFPEELRSLPEPRAALEFCRGIMEAVEPYAAAVKPQAAYFERLGPEGMEAYGELISAARDLGLPTIADVKRELAQAGIPVR